MTVEQREKVDPYVPGSNAFDITANQDGGVLKEIIKPGTGEYTPKTGCSVSVHYVGTLEDGVVFDSSRKRGEPFTFVLGKGSVIKAWDLGVATMKKGETCMLVCRSDYAYGKNGSPPLIQPDTTLHFEIEIIDWQAEDLSSKKDGGILRTILQPGEGFSTPNEGATVSIHLVCECGGKLVDERDVTFCLGEGSEEGVPPGVEKALDKFKLKEKSQLQISPQYGFGSAGKPDLGIPPNSDLFYTVSLNSFEKLQEHWELDSVEKLAQGKLFKEKGTKYFKNEKYSLAVKMYKKMIDYLESEEGFDGELKNERATLTLAAHLNAAACYLKLKENLKARTQCDKALVIDPASEKGLFRRGQAYLNMGEPELACQDFESLQRINPTNKAALSNIQICNQKLKEQKAKEKKIYANMFDKFAQQDREADKDWRFGWWDGDKKTIQVDKVKEEDEEVDDNEDEVKRQLKLKKKFIEDRAKILEERRKLIVGSEKEDKKDEDEEGDYDVKENLKDSTDVKDNEKEEEERKKQPDVMKTLGEWGKDEREREPTDFEKENPNILMLDGTGDFKNM